MERPHQAVKKEDAEGGLWSLSLQHLPRVLGADFMVPHLPSPGIAATRGKHVQENSRASQRLHRARHKAMDAVEESP